MDIDIPSIINNIIRLIAWPIFSGLIILMAIWAGALYILAKGDPAKITKANAAFIWLVFGIIVGVIGFSVQKIITGIIGV